MPKDKNIDMEYEKSRIFLIAAIESRNRALGKDGKLLWHIPDDMRRFKVLTMGRPVIMGRKTWESLPEKFRPLPRRTNIVVTRQVGYEAQDAIVANSFEEARAAAARAKGADEIFIIGGGELYASALPYANRLYLTLVDDATTVADTFFPPYEHDFRIVSKEIGEGEPSHQFLILERK
ncbi:MAG: dihydrofolate reductase [Minisyncoccia bacterium]|jgi:dihydrofolate reductase